MGNEERQTRALESIAKATQEFAKIFEVFNKNIVEFARTVQISEAEELIKRNEKYAIEQLNEHLAPEGYEFVKEEVKKEGD